MSEYTPTTEEVRRCYGDIHCSDLDAGSLENHVCPEEADFNRWLADVERAAAARALEEVADVLGGFAGTILNAESASDIVRARAAEIRERKSE